jgi:DNA-binding NarL/FixJ family response regulator
VKKHIKILMVDDHPMIVWGYASLLQSYAKNYEIEVERAHDTEQALNIVRKNKNKPFDIILMDIKVSVEKHDKVRNVSELGLIIKEITPEVKLIILTIFKDKYRINSILENLNPDGILVKSELTPENLFIAILNVLKNKTHYCQEIARLLRINLHYDKHLDPIDWKILYYISIGEKMRNLPQFIPLSMPSIERRKKRMKILLGVSDGTDRELLVEAGDRGFI